MDTAHLLQGGSVVHSGPVAELDQDLLARVAGHRPHALGRRHVRAGSTKAGGQEGKESDKAKKAPAKKKAAPAKKKAAPAKKKAAPAKKKAAPAKKTAKRSR